MPTSPTSPRAILLALVPLFASCGDEPALGPLPAATEASVHQLAHGCYAVVGTAADGSGGRLLHVTDAGESFVFEGLELEAAARFRLQPSDLATVLFYDTEGHYLVAEADALARRAELLSDVLTNDDAYDPGAEWELEDAGEPGAYRARNRHADRYLGLSGLVAAPEAARLSFIEQDGCEPYPELSLDARGAVTSPPFADGSLFGIVDTHSHILSNFAFGGGGIFHGAPFHPLGVEHALPDCSMVSHGSQGRSDLFGYAYDQDVFDETALITGLITGRTSEPNHATAGYPDFTEWPDAGQRSTHQTQYYRWLERAWMGGLRLVVQHATSNQIICELIVGANVQEPRYSCNDMVATDRIIEETYRMERYIDAQMGGPDEGFFRVVTSPAEAREVIAAGKMAVVLGIETSNLFDCFLTPPAGAPTCDESWVDAQLDRYHELGVRVLFPVHKFDNAFSAGDGDRNFIEAGNFVQTGHWLNFVEECPAVHSVFDKGDVLFGGLNMPREVYDSPPPHDMSGFGTNPIGTLRPFLGELADSPPLVGDYCQNHGLTPLGEHLITEMMKRGMVLEIDHLPRRGYTRAFEMLETLDYPAAGTHGTNNDGRLYALGGVSKTGFGRCHDRANPGTSDDGFQARIQLIREMGGFPAEGFGFDLNGFAGGRGPRFGERGCGEGQANPVTYPFTSYAGDVTFTEPRLGNRTVDFNTEGFVHIGMLPELIQDVRNDGISREELEPLFKSAEGYIRMWERAEERSLELRDSL